jgi:hypothetical protein
LFGKEYLNNSQQTIRSCANSSVFSGSHYRKMDPDGDCLTTRSANDKNESGFDLDKDTLDMIKPIEWSRKSMSRKPPPAKIKLVQDEEEKLMDNDEVDEEWEKFLEEARRTPRRQSVDQQKTLEKAKEEDEEARKEYYRRLVTEEIIHLTEKNQNAVAPSLYAQTLNEDHLFSEKDIDNTSFNKQVSPILNIEIILLVLSRKSLHLSLTSDLETARWKNFLKKFLK